MNTVLLLLLFFIAYLFYKRYVPVLGLKFIELDKVFDQENILLLDVRDFSIANKLPIVRAVNTPLPYLKRNYHELIGKNIYIIGSEKIDVTLSARLLKKKGITIAGYYVMNSEKQVNQTKYDKRRENHGIYCSNEK